MGLDVAQVTMNYLERPEGAAYDFAYDLVEECATSGEGHAFGWFMKEQLRQLASQYIDSRAIDVAGQRRIDDWLESLPYDETEYVVLGFDW